MVVLLFHHFSVQVNVARVSNEDMWRVQAVLVMSLMKRNVLIYQNHSKKENVKEVFVRMEYG